MIYKKIKSIIYDGNRDLQEAMYVVLSVVSVAAWTLMLIEDLILGQRIEETVFLFGVLFMYTAVALVAIKHHKEKIGSVLAAFGMTLFFLPCSYIFDGGISGDAPIWFVYCVFYVTVCLSGKRRVLFYVLNAFSVIICWCISYYAPHMIEQKDTLAVHLYSFNALVLVCICISISLIFQSRMYRREVKRSDEQRVEIEQLNQAQNQFFSNMSHEIRTPINTIIGLNEMILRENISDEVAEDAINIQSASKMLLHLINDILDMSKLASGQMQLTPVVYNSGDMLSDIVGMLWLRAKEKNLEFHINVAPDIPAELVGDEVRIKQVLINVLNNAIKYTSEGSVSLSVQRGEYSDGMLNVIYSVTDTGMGIKKESIPYLFAAFRRVDEEKNRHIEGTGLGLSIVKQFVDLMGGKITVNSIYTEGTTFIIEIPQRVSGEQEIGDIDIEARKEMHVRHEHVTRFEAPEAKVLVVDDNASNLLVVSKLLRNTKVQLTTASSGADALQKTLNEYYHVIFMDHLMPEMDGIECMKAIRTQVGGRCKESRIVALTANAGGDSRALYEKEGFEGYLVKPISGDLLERELYRLLPSDVTNLIGDDEDILQETISWMNKGQRKVAVAITTESVADLPQELVDKYEIAILPHLVHTAEGTFKDGLEIETQGLLSYMDDPDKVVSYGGPSVKKMEAFFAENLHGANDIIHISISKGLANSAYFTAVEAAKAFDNVKIFDTGHLSSGHGLMALEACRLVKEGKRPDEIMEELEVIKERVNTSFVVDNLDFLARAGQVSPRIARITKSIMARPVLVMKKGDLGVGRIYFGARERAWRKYIDSVLKYPMDIDTKILFVTYVGLTKKDMDWIRERIEERMQFETIYFQKASPVIAVNCGRGTFGLLYLRKK
ncbi:MAG: DegV family EDD domain-containing protein [Lachnospiraceae bacterium]|jgi:DegV family protein with EDD domain|nr:DegV family EDD domain-containing protein [Lachnospiraceae bacterium]